MDPGLRILDIDNSNTVLKTEPDFYLLAFVPTGGILCFKGESLLFKYVCLNSEVYFLIKSISEYTDNKKQCKQKQIRGPSDP